MNHVAQMCANLMLSFEAMSGPAAYGEPKFGPFELSIGERLLRREGVVLPLGSRALAEISHCDEAWMFEEKAPTLVVSLVEALGNLAVTS